jgi:hypothetical protein
VHRVKPVELKKAVYGTRSAFVETDLEHLARHWIVPGAPVLDRSDPIAVLTLRASRGANSIFNCSPCPLLVVLLKTIHMLEWLSLGWMGGLRASPKWGSGGPD